MKRRNILDLNGIVFIDYKFNLNKDYDGLLLRYSILNNCTFNKFIKFVDISNSFVQNLNLFDSNIEFIILNNISNVSFRQIKFPKNLKYIIVSNPKLLLNENIKNNSCKKIILK